MRLMWRYECAIQENTQHCPFVVHELFCIYALSFWKSLIKANSIDVLWRWTSCLSMHSLEMHIFLFKLACIYHVLESMQNWILISLKGDENIQKLFLRDKFFHNPKPSKRLRRKKSNKIAPPLLQRLEQSEYDF